MWMVWWVNYTRGNVSKFVTYARRFPLLLTGLDMSSSTESGVTEPPYWILTASAVSYHT